MTKNFKNIKFNRLIRLGNGGVVGGGDPPKKKQYPSWILPSNIPKNKQYPSWMLPKDFASNIPRTKQVNINIPQYPNFAFVSESTNQQPINANNIKVNTTPETAKEKAKREAKQKYEAFKQSQVNQGTIDLPSDDWRANTPFNAQWQYPALTGKTKAMVTNMNNQMLSSFLPTPVVDDIIGLGAKGVGKLIYPFINKLGKPSIKNISKIINESSDNKVIPYKLSKNTLPENIVDWNKVSTVDKRILNYPTLVTPPKHVYRTTWNPTNVKGYEKEQLLQHINKNGKKPLISTTANRKAALEDAIGAYTHGSGMNIGLSTTTLKNDALGLVGKADLSIPGYYSRSLKGNNGYENATSYLAKYKVKPDSKILDANDYYILRETLQKQGKNQKQIAEILKDNGFAGVKKWHNSDEIQWLNPKENLSLKKFKRLPPNNNQSYGGLINNDNMKNKTRVPINYNSYGGKLIRRKSLETGGNISGNFNSKLSNVAGIAGFFQAIGKMGEDIGNSISKGAYDPNTGKYRTGQYAIGRGIYGAFNPLMAGIESISRKDTLLDTAIAFGGLGNIVGAFKHSKAKNREVDEMNEEIKKIEEANKLIRDKQIVNQNIIDRYGYDTFLNRFNRYGGKLAFGGSTSNIPDSNAIPIDGNDELVVNNQGGTQGFHETGQNIPAYDSNGQETAQVEPGEVIMELPNGEKYALSKRLGVAQKYLEYIQIKEKLVQEMIATDIFKRNAIKREIDSIDAKIQQLPAYQEQLKQQYGIEDEEVQQQGIEQQVPIAKCGRKLPDGGFLDAIINNNMLDYMYNYNNTIPYRNIPALADESKVNPNTINFYKSDNYNRLLNAPYSDNTNKLIYPDVPVQPEQLVDEPDYTKLINNYNRLLNAPYSDNTNIFNKSNTYTGKLNGNTIPNKSYNNIYGGGAGGGYGSSTYTGGLNGDKSYTGEELYQDSLNRTRTRTPNKLFNPKNLGTVKDIATTVLPFVDNVVNYFMTKKTPKIPKPILDKYTPLEERVNVENQISSIERSKKELFKDIDNNVSNVQQANAMKREISRKADDAINSIYEKKENTEIGLRNENKLRKNIIDSSNNRLLDAYNMAKAQREFGIMQDHSTNLANMSDDIYNLMNRSDLKRNEQIELKAIGKFFNADVSSYLFEDLPEFFRMQSSDSLNKFIKESKNKRAVEFATNILKERGDLKE